MKHFHILILAKAKDPNNFSLFWAEGAIIYETGKI